VKRVCALVLVVMFFQVRVTCAQQGPEKGGHEIELWTSGGLGFSGITAGTGIWNFGARYGWILTDYHGPGFLRSRFEYAADIIPVFLVFQPTGTAYGFGINPVTLKWDFEVHHTVTPYFEIYGGTVFTDQTVPSGTTRTNFTTGASLGVHFLRNKYYWGTDVRFLHLSNANLTFPNPGINSLQVRVGIGQFILKK
jgi:hypothetical protein